MRILTLRPFFPIFLHTLFMTVMAVLLFSMFCDVVISAAKNITTNEKINKNKYTWLLAEDNTFLNHFNEGWKMNLFEFFVSNNNLKPPSIKGYSMLNSRPENGFEITTKEDKYVNDKIRQTDNEEEKNTEIDLQTSNSDNHNHYVTTGQINANKDEMDSMNTVTKFVGRDYYTLHISNISRKTKQKNSVCHSKGKCCERNHTGVEIL